MAPLCTEIRALLDTLDGAHNAMVDNTIALATINSGSLNRAGVNSVLQWLIRLTQSLGAEVEIISVAPFEVVGDDGDITQYPLGDALRLRKRPDAPVQIYLGGHMDTVFGKNHPFQKVTWLDENTLNGPGVTDLKGGLVLMIEALKVLEASPWAEQVGWELLFNPDEEIGSQGSAPLIKEAAQRVQLGMIYEPAFSDGNLAGARKGSGNFSIISHGKAAHAGREHHFGRNAVRALCDFVSAMDNLNGKRTGVTFNPAYIHGGGPTNVVPDCAIHKFNVRIEQPDDEAWVLDQLAKILDGINQRDGLQLTIHGGFTRPPKILTAANQQLFDFATNIARELGMTIEVKPTGGCCDGNNLAACGVPNIDTLGVVGGNIHSDQEYVDVSSFVPRAKLSAAILLTLAKSSACGTLPEWLTKEPS